MNRETRQRIQDARDALQKAREHLNLATLAVSEMEKILDREAVSLPTAKLYDIKKVREAKKDPPCEGM